LELRSEFGFRAEQGEIRSDRRQYRSMLVEKVVDKVLAVARAANIVPPGIEDPKVAMAGAMKIATQMAGALSSTAQDINCGKRTEIDSLNGYISRRGARKNSAMIANP
jgi:2-dehydropantoate 2-reductase